MCFVVRFTVQRSYEYNIVNELTNHYTRDVLGQVLDSEVHISTENEVFIATQGLTGREGVKSNLS